MFCRNCGAENNHNGKFCTQCGSALSAIPITKTESDESKIVVSREHAKVDPAKAGGENLAKITGALNISVKTFLIAVVCLVIGIAAIVSVIAVKNHNKKVIDLNDYLSVTFSGYGGYGDASVELDRDAIYEEYADIIDFTEGHDEAEFFLTSALTILMGNVDYDVSQTRNLSNGDVINITWNVTSNNLDAVDGELKYEDISMKVTGLQDVQLFNAFEDVEVSFDGYDGDGIAYIKYTGTEFASNYYSIFSDDMFLNNGDTIIVKFGLEPLSDSQSLDAFVSKYNKLPEKLQKEFVVEGLPVNDINSILSENDDGQNTALDGNDAYNDEENVDADNDGLNAIDSDEGNDIITGDYYADPFHSDFNVIFSYNDTELIDPEELTYLSEAECKIARNEIYAHHGMIFEGEDMIEHFSQMSWYQPTVPKDSFDESVLNEIEKKNIDIIHNYEVKMGYNNQK